MRSLIRAFGAALLILCLSGQGTNNPGGGSGSGTVTSVGASNGICGGPITTSGTLTACTTDNTKTSSYQVASGDMGNALNLAATTGTPALTLPAESSSIFAPGMTLSIVVTGTVNWTLTNSTGLTITGLNSTTLTPGTSGTFLANANGTGLDFFPGAQPPTSTSAGGVNAGGDLSFSGTTPTVAKIGGVAITLGTLTNNDACTYASSGTVLNCNSSFLPLGGGTLTGKLTTVASATGGAGFNLPQGAAPSSPSNGDMWATSSGVYAYIAGSQVGPFGTSGSGCTSSGASILYGNGSGGCSNVTVGSGLSFSGGTLSATGGGSSTIVASQGRLTLVSGTPVMTANETAQSTIYFDCYKGNNVPYYSSGSALDTISSCEESDALESSGTGEVLASGVFDEWYSHAGTAICHATNGSGGGWASDSGSPSNQARGTGYSQVHNTKGFVTNVNSVSDCYNGTTNECSTACAADTLTYLGSFYTTANGQTGMAFTGSGSGGGAPCMCLYNAYNREPQTVTNQDTTASWSTESASWVKSDNSASDAVEIVDGLAQSQLLISDDENAEGSGSGAAAGIGVLEDATTGTPQIANFNYVSTVTYNALHVTDRFLPKYGYHYVQQMETTNTASVARTFFAGAAIASSNVMQLAVTTSN